MFKRILIPTDGSAPSRRAAQHAIELARATGAMLVGFYAVPAYTSHLFEDFVRDFVVPSEFAKHARNTAKRHLDHIHKRASEAGVRFTGRYALSHSPAAAIVAAAKQFRCDTIVMGSHGRGGMKKFLLGSQAQEVLASTKLPVVISR